MKISASLYAADPLRLAEAVAAVAPHVDSLHVDVMDGRFAPAFGFGERLVESLVHRFQSSNHIKRRCRVYRTKYGRQGVG
jgi:pentose-5-phosphate-3-epimerase